ncbi:hypothetical protein RJD40_21060 [Vibrio scophthalmi]|uniref:hypothetical protein n=1 Tax=Vibrio scophthalmi TaxID=45658 RepID=UPI003AAF054A
MLGFVSALSSAVAVMVLVMVTMLARKIEVDHNNALLVSSFVTLSDSAIQEVSKENLESKNIVAISELQALIPDGSLYGISCSYGYDISKKNAEKYKVFNFIIIRGILGAENVFLAPTYKNAIAENSCHIVKKER